MPWIDDPCPRCALPGCSRCPHARASFGAAYAPVAHVGPARDLLLALKLRRALPAADAIAGQILARVPDEALCDAALVPLPGWAAERIAHALGRATGRPVVRCLARAPGAGARQVGRDRAERLGRARLQLEGAPPPPGAVVLVDDVHTTGATLETGARVLQAAGFLEIAAVTYVRTLTTA